MTQTERKQFQETLKMASGEELAAVGLHLAADCELPVEEQVEAMSLVNGELAIRRNEPFMRKTSRFMSKHGNSILAMGIGAVLGIEIGDGG